MTDVFAKMIDEVIGKEGRYANHPSDRGGETMWGITHRVARRAGYTGPMAAMPREVAAAIYRRTYLIEPGFADIAQISEPVAVELFDTGVNCGAGTASLFLQRALNGLNGQGRDYPDVKEDGDVGPATLRALRSFIAKRGQAAAETALLRLLNGQQATYYLDITRSRQANEDFLYGWITNRVE